MVVYFLIHLQILGEFSLSLVIVFTAVFNYHWLHIGEYVPPFVAVRQEPYFFHRNKQQIVRVFNKQKPTN